MNQSRQVEQQERNPIQDVYGYWLHHIAGVGNKTIENLLNCFGNEHSIYEANPKQLQLYVSKKQLESMEKSKETWNLQKEYEKLQTKNIFFYPITNPNYPKKLKEIPDAPYGIYNIGKLPEENKVSVAIIGARTCSEYGKYMAREFAFVLASAGVQIISGLARGIDSIGQKAALNAGGSTFSVLGSGVDVCYPEENQEIYHNIIKSNQGGIISEFLPKTEPKASFFPMRNRIISGLADVVLVIEAKERSGTLITVDMALEQGREVYALPGRATDLLSFGCNRLIKQGAGIALSPNDFLTELCLTKKMELENQIEIRQIANPYSKLLSPMEQHILQELELGPKSLDWIYSKLLTSEKEELNLPQIIEKIMELCMKGLVIQENGCYSMVNHYN